MQNDELQSSAPGRQLVAVIILAAVTVGIIGAAYVRIARRAEKTPEPDAAQLDVDQAKEELRLLTQTYLSIHDQRDKLGPFIEAVRKFVERNEQYAPGHKLLGQIRLDAGRSREALDSLEQSLDLNQRQPELRCMAGVVAEKLGDMDKAAKYFLEAIGLDPRNGQFRMHLANVYLHRNELAESKHTFLEALRMDSSLHEAHAALSGIYDQEGRRLLAITQIRKAVELTLMSERTKHVIYVRKQAKLELRDGRPDDALRTLQSLTMKERFEPAIMEDMATCWANKSRPDLAAELYEDALAIFPTNWRYVAGAANWRLLADDNKAFERHLRMLRRLDSSLPVIAVLERRRTARQGDQQDKNEP